MKYVETTGKTVDDAITEALVQLGLPSDQVDIEVLFEGSKGVLGIFGAKEAKIRATAKVQTVEEQIFTDNDKKAPSEEKKAAANSNKPENKQEKPVKKAENAEKAPQKVNKAPEKAAEKAVEKAAAKSEEKSKEVEKTTSEKSTSEKPTYIMDTLVEDRLRAARANKASRAKENMVKEDKASYSKNKEQKSVVEEEPKDPAEYAADAKIAEEAAIAFLKPLLEKMGLQVEITPTMEEADVLCLNIEGENLGMIIGKRGNTLDSLQYLTTLVAGKKTEKRIKIKLDAENYREKRKETLEKLAINLAKKARKTNSRVALEPMNPYERRIIHSALQNFSGVETHSEGEEPFRKVIISPVRSNFHRH